MPTNPLRRLVAATALALAAGTPHAAANLIANGDFEAGATGFVTDYLLSSSGCITCIGVRARTRDWYNVPSLVFDYGDHTSGSGLMLQYDPFNGVYPRIWAQVVQVTAGTTYRFSGWVREANSEPSPNNGRVGVYAAGQLLGQQDAPDGDWAQWSFDWTATSTGAVELALRDLYPTTYSGTYSTIDDLSFTAAVPEPSSWVLMALGVAGLVWRRRRAA